MPDYLMITMHEHAPCLLPSSVMPSALALEVLKDEDS